MKKQISNGQVIQVENHALAEYAKLRGFKVVASLPKWQDFKLKPTRRSLTPRNMPR